MTQPGGSGGAAIARQEPVAALTRGMRLLLLAAAVLVVLAGIQLFVFAGRTDEWFAWTIAPPMTAAFLGAAYWASAGVELASARARSWADARIAVPSVLVFTVLTMVVTVVHLDRFHLGEAFAANTRAVTWAWIAVYAVVPVLLAVVWLRQARMPGTDPPRQHPLPRVLLMAVAAMAALLLGYGAWLLLAPESAAQPWPWQLTPLTARAIGAWLVGLGVSAAQTVREADAIRTRPVAVGALVLPILLLVALIRYAHDVAWSSAGAWVLILVVVAWFAIGAAIIAIGRRPAVG